jgi:GTPase
LPEGMPFFPEGQVTDLYEREIAADLIREAALLLLRDEVPHGIAIRIDQYLERGDSGSYIEATLFVERESHKGIVIGQGGMMLKKIGSAARREIETMSGRKVFLKIKVKVRKNWRDDEKVLRWFGY